MMPPYQLVEKYNSKKNHVCAVDIRCKEGKKRAVLKDFNSMENKHQEVFYLQLLSDNDVKVPKMLYHHNKMIMLEHIEGEILLDWIIALEEGQVNPKSEKCKKVFYKLLSWLNDFYTLTEDVLGKKIIFGDVHFRNFIIKDDLYGFDFEDCREGIPEEDGGAICAHLLTYYPEDTSWKRKACSVLQSIMIEDFQYDADRLEEATSHYLHVIKERRSTSKKK